MDWSDDVDPAFFSAGIAVFLAPRRAFFCVTHYPCAHSEYRKSHFLNSNTHVGPDINFFSGGFFGICARLAHASVTQKEDLDIPVVLNRFLDLLCHPRIHSSDRSVLHLCLRCCEPIKMTLKCWRKEKPWLYSFTCSARSSSNRNYSICILDRVDFSSVRFK